MKFRVIVNGKEYIVEVMEIEGGEPVATSVIRVEQSEAPKAVEEGPKEKEVELPKEIPKEIPSGEGEIVVAPLPGKITKIVVKEGEHVKSGQPLLYIEAMKMENEVSSPKDGVIAKIHVREEETVDINQPLVEIR